MKTFLKISAVMLLLFNSIGAIYGGGSLILYPDGSAMHLSLSLLLDTPFRDYLIPGIVLFTVNGLFGFYVLLTLLFNFKKAWVYVAAQGAVLTVWITVQVMLINVIYILHYVMGGTGIILILLGILIKKYSARAKLPLA